MDSVLRHATAVVVFFGIIWAAGLPDGDAFGPRWDQEVRLVQTVEADGGVWLQPVVVPRPAPPSPPTCSVAVLIIDPRVYVPAIEVEVER